MLLTRNERWGTATTRVSGTRVIADTFTNLLSLPSLSHRKNVGPRSFEDERQAFRSMLPMLKARYSGQYVAIFEGRIAATGATMREAAQAFFADHDKGPVYIGFVGPRRIIRQSSPFRARRNARVP